MTLCKDCMYFIVNGAKCSAAGTTKPDYVNGKPGEAFFAQIVREHGVCGPEGKLFRAIPVAVDA